MPWWWMAGILAALAVGWVIGRLGDDARPDFDSGHWDHLRDWDHRRDRGI